MGSTLNYKALLSRYQNHPHVYGEYPVPSGDVIVVPESPPCVWGVLHGNAVMVIYARITPMCMGSTLSAKCSKAWSRNHPHVYGEYETSWRFCIDLVESPPCVWGVLPEPDYPYVTTKNHPHEYGEYSLVLVVTLLTVESPPCVWGVRSFLRSGRKPSRITPMCMGSTVKIT